MTRDTITPANTLRTWTEVECNAVYIHYQIDHDYAGQVRLRLPFGLEAHRETARALFGLWGGVFIGQLCLARNIVFASPVFEGGWPLLLPIVENLYSVRAYRDRLPLQPIPRPTILQTSTLAPRPTIDSRRAYLLWSGGVDSSLSLLLLERNGYEVMPVHVTINTGAIAGETAAVQSMARLLNKELSLVDYQFDQYLEIARRYSAAIDVFPLENAVPHGRELLLVPIAVLHALEYGGQAICLGHEHNAWTRQIEYMGHIILRCDTQSEAANLVMSDFLRSLVSPNINLFSPVAPFSDFLKFMLLAQHNGALLGSTNSCFWGNWCGLCQKCSLTYVLQRMLGKNIITFGVDPLAENGHLRRMVQEWSTRTQTNWKEHQYALATIVGRGEFDATESLLVRYKNDVLPQILPILQELEQDLTTVYSVKLLPEGFRLDLGS